MIESSTVGFCYLFSLLMTSGFVEILNLNLSGF